MIFEDKKSFRKRYMWNPLRLSLSLSLSLSLFLSLSLSLYLNISLFLQDVEDIQIDLLSYVMWSENSYTRFPEKYCVHAVRNTKMENTPLPAYLSNLLFW